MPDPTNNNGVLDFSNLKTPLTKIEAPSKFGEEIIQSKYEQESLPGSNVGQLRADRQGWASESANMIIGGLAKIPMSVTGNFASMLDFEDYYNQDNEVGNEITRIMEAAKEDVSKALPIYTENNADLGSREWWLSNGQGLIESVGAFAITGGGIGGAANKGINLLTKIPSLAKFANAARVTSGVLQTVALNQAESIPSAINVYNDSYNFHLESLQKDVEAGKITKEQAEEQSKIVAADAAAYNINFNRLNIPLNLTSSFAFLRTPAFTRNLVTDIGKKKVLKNIISEGTQEYLEENINMIAENEARKSAQDGKKYSFDIGRVVNDIFSKEGFQSGLLGFIGGAGQTGATALVNLMQNDSYSFDENGNVRTDNLGQPIMVNQYQSEREQATAQNNVLNKINQINIANGLPDLKEVLDKTQKLSTLLNDIQEAAIDQKFDKVEELQNNILTIQALEAFKTGQTEALINQYKNIAQDPDAKEKLGEDYNGRIFEAVQTIEKLESIFNNQIPIYSPVTNELFTNRANHYFAMQGAEKIQQDLNKAKINQQKELDLLGAASVEQIAQLPSTIELQKQNNRLNETINNILTLNDEYNKLLTPEYQAEVIKNRTGLNTDTTLGGAEDAETTQEETPVIPTSDLEKEFNTKSTEELTGMLDMLTDPNNALATDPDAAADIKANIEAISKVLEQRKQKTAKPTEQQPVDKKVTPTGTVPQYTEEELADLMDEDLFVPEVPDADELQEDDKTFSKVVELKTRFDAGEISQDEFNEGIANIGKAVKPREPVSPEQDVVSNSMVNDYVDTAELASDDDVNKQDAVQNNTDDKSLAKMSNVAMMTLFKHAFDVIPGTVIKFFKWVRGAEGKVIVNDNNAVSSNVNNPDVANKGSKIIYSTDIKLSPEAQELNNKNIERSKKIINAALKAYPQLGYTEADAKFEGPEYTATIGMFTEDGTLVGYYQLPHAIDVTKTTSSDDLANYVKVRQQILAERKAILDKINKGEEASTEVLDKGYGNLLTQVVDNKPVMQGNLFSTIREEDKFNGQPVFIFEGAKGFEIKGYQELRDEYNSFVTSLPKFNKTGRVYQVIRAANGKYSIIPVYTNLIDNKVADKIIQTIQNLDDAPNYNDIISALNPYIYAGDSKKRPGVSMDVSGDGAKTKFTIGGEVYTLQEIQNNSSRLADFKQALLKKRHNLEVNKLNDANYQKELANNNAISTNAYTSEGQYFVQPLIIVKPIVGEAVKVTPTKEKVTEVKPTVKPTTDAKDTTVKIETYEGVYEDTGETHVVTVRTMADGSKIIQEKIKGDKTPFPPERIKDDQLNLPIENFTSLSKGSLTKVSEKIIDSSVTSTDVKADITSQQWDEYYGTKDGKYEDGKVLAKKFYNPLYAAIDALKVKIANLPNQFISVDQGKESLKKYGFTDFQIENLKKLDGNVLEQKLSTLNKRVSGMESTNPEQNKIADEIINKFKDREVVLFNSVTGLNYGAKSTTLSTNAEGETKEEYVNRRKSEIFKQLKDKYPTLITGDTINPMMVQPKYMSSEDIDMAQKVLDTKILELEYDAELAALEGKEEVIPTAEPITNDDIIISTKDEVETDEDYKKAQDALKAKFAIDPNELLSDGDAFSRGSMAIDGKPVDPSLVKEAKDFISKYVPFLTLSDLNTVSQVKGAMIDSIGMLRGTTMYLFQGSTIKTAYHESFHGVFRNMLTKAEQQAVLNEMRDKYGKPTQAELNYQIEAIPAYYKSVLSQEEINMFAENKHFEEKLADEFMEVADTEINKPWYKKIADFFKRIFNMFNIFSKTTMSESELLFRNILAKKYATGKPVVLNKDLSAYNEIPAFSRTEQDTKISPVTRGQRVNSIAAEFVKRYMNLVKSGKTITREDGPRIFNEIRNSYKQFFIAQFKEGFPNAQAAAVANYVKSNFDTFVSDAISVIRTTYKIKADKNGIIEMLKNQLDSEEQGEDVEYTEIEETGMTKEYGQDFINISGIKSASTRLKLALSFVPKRDADGVVEKDPYGFDKYYNHEQVYYWLERNLVGITDMNEMLDAIKSASVFKPELGDVYNMLTETKEGDNLKEHEMFKNEFRSNFAKQQMAYLLILFEKQGKNEAPKYKIIDSNRQSLAREIFDRWKNNVRDISGTIAETAPDGQVIIHGTKAAKELKAKYQSMIGTITPSQMREVLAKVGIIYSDGVVEKVFESNDKEAMIKSVIPVLDWYASDDPAMEETQGRINLGNLVKYELNGNLNSYTSSFNNVENRAIYTIQNPSYASKIISTIKGKKAKFDAFYNERMKDPFFKHSNLLEELTSNIFREERFKVYFLNGLKDGKGSGMGAKWTKMSAADKFSMVLELFSNKKETISQTKTEATAYYSNITESDKTLHSLIRSKKYVVKTMLMEVNGKTTRVINPNSEIVEKFYNVALNEAGRIKSALEFKEKLLSATGEERTALEGKLLEHYHFKKGNKLAFDGQAYKFMQIDGLNSLLEPITEAISNNSEQDISDILEPLKTEIKQAIADDLTRLYRQTLVEAVNAGAVKVENGLLKSVTLDVYDVNEEGNRKGLRPEEEQLKIQQLLASFSANEYLNNIEYSAIMNGDLAFYKPGDGPKRFYQANSMTRSWNTNTISKIKFAVVDDLETVTNPKTLEYLKDKLGDKAEKNWGEAAKAINVTDATVFISPELFLKIHEAQGTWTPAIQKAYDIAQGIIEPDNKDTSWHNQITVSKPFIYGQEFDPSIGAMRPVQIKCTFVPLMKTFTDSNPLLADMALRMKESKTDAVAMKSAMKASMNITDDLLTTKLGFNNSLEVSVDNAGIQVDNPDHLVDSVSSSNRQQKMLLPAMIDIGHTYNGRAGIDIRTEINEIEAINVSEDKTRLDKIFGTKEFNEDIAEALNSRNANNNQRQVLHVNDDGTFDYPLDMINSTSSENLISSIFTKRVVKQDFKGGSAVQVTGVGYKFKSDYKTVGDVQAIIDTNEELKKLQSDLEYIKASKDNPNQIDYVDVVMPAWDSRFFSIDKNGNTVLTDINSLPNNIKNFILQRIPNEGPHSNMVVRVKQFLPAEYGNMIILPYEVTKQLGSDFDFDKVFFHITEFFKDKDGSFKKVEFIDGTDDKAVDTRYNIYVNDAIRKNRNKLPVEAVVKSELNRLINTVKQKGIELGLKTNDRVYQLLDEIQELENKVRLNTATKKDKATLDNKLIEFASIELVRNSLEEKLDQAYQNKNTVDKMMLDKLIDMNLVVTKEDFAKRTIIGQNIKPARNNRLLDNYDTVLRDVHHLEDVTTPSGFENIEEVFNKVSGNSTLLNFYTGNTQRYLADLFHAIIGLKGQSATHVTGHAFGSMMRLSPKTKFYLVDKKGNSVEYNSLSNRTSKDGTLIIKDISSMMAAILDAVKKPDLLPGLGINSKSIDAWATIVRLGMGTEVASLFTASPAIKELTNALISNNNQIKSEDFKFKAAKDIIAKYKSELNEVIKYLPEDKLDTFDRSPINKAISDNKTYVSFKPTQMLADIQLANDPAKLNDAEVRAYYLANQVRLLQMYTHMEGTMNFLNDFNRFTAINKEVGPNIEDIIDKVYLEKKLVNSNAVEGFATESLPQLNSIFDAHRIALEKLNEHFPYASDQYSYIKSQIARMQYKDTGATEDILNIASEDRQKINGFIKAYIDGNAPVLSEVTTTEEKKRLFTKLPLKLSEIQKPSNDKKEGFFNGALRKSPLIENLKVERLTEGENLWYISVKGNRLTPDMQNLMADSFMALYNNKETKDFAIDLIKHSFASTGFYTGLNSFAHIIPPSILMDLGYVEYRRNEVNAVNNNKFVISIDDTNNLVDQLVRNFPKIFTDTYNDEMFIGFETESKPTYVEINEAKLKDSGRSNTLVVGEIEGEDGVSINKYQRYIRVYSNKYKGSLLYKNVSPDNIDTRYELINYLGQSGKLIEIDPKGKITESIIRTNNYKTPVVTTVTSEALPTATKPMNNPYAIIQDDINDSEDNNDEVDVPVETKQGLTISTPSTESTMTADQLGLGDLTEDDFAEMMGDDQSEIEQIQDDADDLPDDIEPGDCKPTKK